MDDPVFVIPGELGDPSVPIERLGSETHPTDKMKSLLFHAISIPSLDEILKLYDCLTNVK